MKKMIFIGSASLAMALGLSSPLAIADNDLERTVERACSTIRTFTDEIRYLPSDESIENTYLDDEMKEKITGISHDAAKAYLEQLSVPISKIDALIQDNPDDEFLTGYIDNKSCSAYHFMKDDYVKWGDNVPNRPNSDLADTRCLGVAFTKDGINSILDNETEGEASLSYAYFMHMIYSNKYRSVATDGHSCDEVSTYLIDRDKEIL